METSLSYTETGAFLSSDEKAIINRFETWIRDGHESECRVIRRPAENDGCLYIELFSIEIAQRCLRRLFNPKREISEEQREKARERMLSLRSR